MEYPKTENLFVRDLETHKVIPGQLRRPEFAIPQTWLVTEKIDGTNVRLWLTGAGVRDDGSAGSIASVIYGGRTDAAQMPKPLLAVLQDRFPASLIAAAFEPGTSAIIYGEGYGPGIQKGGGNYSPVISFRVFDVAILTSSRVLWLNWSDVEDVARKIGAKTVPVIGPRESRLDEAVAWTHSNSPVASEETGQIVPAEGVVARTDPLLFTRWGQRVVWKLKARDF